MDVAAGNTTLLIHEPCNTISSFRSFDENLDTTASPTSDFNIALSLLSFGSAFFHGSSCSNGVANNFDVLGIGMVMVSDGTMVPLKLKFGRPSQACGQMFFWVLVGKPSFFRKRITNMRGAVHFWQRHRQSHKPCDAHSSTRTSGGLGNAMRML
jgi:hypothetical protein